MLRRESLRHLTAMFSLAATATWLTACKPSPESFKGVDITGATYAKDFALLDPQGQRRTLADFKGKVVAVFFGFTQCPDVCPTTLLELSQVREALGQDADRLQGIFITLDPERDTPEILQAYVSNFGPGFTALRPTMEELPDLAQHFKIFFKKVPTGNEGNYSLDHSAGTYFYDPHGRLRVFSRYGSAQEDLVADVKTLLSTPALKG